MRKDFSAIIFIYMIILIHFMQREYRKNKDKTAVLHFLRYVCALTENENIMEQWEKET